MANDTAKPATSATHARPPVHHPHPHHHSDGPHGHHHHHHHHHELHLLKARALLDAMDGLGRRGRLHSSPAMLAAAASSGRCARKPLPSSVSASELRAVALSEPDLDADAERIDTGDEGDDDDDGSDHGATEASHVAEEGDVQLGSGAVALALALLQRALEAADQEGAEGVATVSKEAVGHILVGFVTALEMAVTPSAAVGSTTSREVEHQMQRLFVSHANVFDEKVQNFIIQNFIQQTDYAKAFRSAVRRTSLVKRCLKAMYPSEKTPRPASSSSSHWNASLAQRAMATAHVGALEACPEVTDAATIASVRQLLGTVSRWDFDLFSLVEAVPGQSLVLIGHELLNQYDLCTHFRTTKARQLEFLRQIQSKYHAHPYHNAEHAADVTQTLHHFLAVGKLGDTVNARSKCAALVAAIIHDVGHTSFTNNFHISANDDLAVKYVYRSPLEHMHCALAFQLMKAPKTNVLQGLSRIEQMEVRTLITDMVLATDNSVHAAYLAKLEGLLCRASDAATWTLSANPDDERLVLQMALHAADVSNPTKPLQQCRAWAERILLEFHQQGDKERELELPVSIGYDRESPIPLEKMQAGFILGVVRPLFIVFCQLPRAELAHCLTHLDENLAYWQSEISRTQV